MKRLRKISLILTAATVLILILSACGKSENVENESFRLIKIEKAEGDVSLERDSENIEVFNGMNLVKNDMVTTGNQSTAQLLVDTDKHIISEENTVFSVYADGDTDNGKVKINLESGTGLFVIDNKLVEGSEFIVDTPNAVLSVRGTRFCASYDKVNRATAVAVYEGVVLVENSDIEEILNPGDIAVIKDDVIDVSVEAIDISMVDIQDYSAIINDYNAIEWTEAEEDNAPDNEDADEIGQVDDIEVGDELAFGKYDGEDIMWDVLEVNDDNLLLISHNVLTNMPLHDNYDPCEWESSSLRNWLNEYFYDTSFSADEQALIQTMTHKDRNQMDFYLTYASDAISAEDEDPHYSPESSDKVYLLSWEEIDKYYGIEIDPDGEYENMMGSKSYSYPAIATSRDGENCSWWTRNVYAGCVLFCNDDGLVSHSFTGEECVEGVRPVICINK